MHPFRFQINPVATLKPFDMRSPDQPPSLFRIVRYLFLLCSVFLIIACGDRRSGPGYSMILPDATITPAPVRTIDDWHEQRITDSLTVQSADKVVAAIIDEGQPVYVALAQSGLWMGSLQDDGSYLWSRPPGVPEVLTTNDISALDFVKFEEKNEKVLRVGTHNHGYFQFSLSDDNREWLNATVENSDLPSNKVNRIVGHWILTTEGAALPRVGEDKWTIYNTETGLLNNNIIDIGGIGGYSGGASVIATESGVAIAYAGGKMEYSRLSGGTRCHFEHVSRLYYVSGKAWLMIDQKDVTAPNGWRVAGVCTGAIELFSAPWSPVSLIWDPVLLDGVAPVDARIVTHYQDWNERMWIALASETATPQGTLAGYDPRKEGWTSYQLPAEMPAIADDAVMLLVGDDLWVAKPDEAAFTVLENVPSQE